MTEAKLNERIATFLKFARASYVAKHAYHSRYREEIDFVEDLAAFCALTKPDRERVRALLNDYFDASNFAHFAIRSASFAIQTANMEHLRNGSVALTVDADVMDPRDHVTALGILNAAANRLGFDLSREITIPLREITTDGRRKLIEHFLSVRPDAMKEVKSFGFELALIDGLLWFRNIRV